jgi:RNA polymerase sigma-70 factor (ECF subfamily)
MNPTDVEYIKNVLNGCPDDYRYIVQRYQGALLSYLGGILGELGLAEEAAQETFVRAYFGLHKLAKPQSLHAWLLGIAARVAKELQRTRKRHRNSDAGLAGVAMPAPRATGEERDQQLRLAVANLPGYYQRVVQLRYYGGLSCQELARELGVPLGTVTKTLSRAYTMLRQELTSPQARAVRQREAQS